MATGKTRIIALILLASCTSEHCTPSLSPADDSDVAGDVSLLQPGDDAQPGPDTSPELSFSADSDGADAAPDTSQVDQSDVAETDANASNPCDLPHPDYSAPCQNWECTPAKGWIYGPLPAGTPCLKGKHCNGAGGCL